MKSIKSLLENIDQQRLLDIGISALKAVLIFIFARIAINIVNRIIHSFFLRQKKSKYGLNEKKADTLSELLKSIARYAIYIIAALWILEAIGLGKLTTLVAFTSVAGVALGFGAQNLVKDVISGFFILFEDQFAVGDYIEVEGKTGFVEALGLRITKIRDFSGDLHIIPNGSITKVTNKSRGNARALVDVKLDYEEDVDRAIAIITNITKDVKKDMEDIVEGPDVLGITEFSENGVNIRIIAKTLPMKQWNVEMEIRRKIKYAFEKAGIKMSYQRRLIINRGDEKDDNKF